MGTTVERRLSVEWLMPTYFPMLSSFATVALRGVVLPVSQFDMLLADTPSASANCL